MKIVFLDFDGVCNSFSSRGREPDGWNQLDRNMVARVSTLVEKTGAKVVVSSSWRLEGRRYRSEKERCGRVADILKMHGFTGEVIDITPHVPGAARGWEIQQWLLAQESQPEAFIILDDCNDMAHLKDRLVQTVDERGLTDEDVDKAIALLST